MTVNVNKPGIDLRSTITQTDKPTGTAGEALLRAETVQQQQTLLGVGRRNWIINGDMKLSQRGDYTSATSLTDETYYLDRFEQNIGTVTCTGQQISTNQPAELGGTKSWKLVATSSATGFMGTRQIIEDYTVFNGRPFTVSCYIKTNHPSVRFYHYDGSTAKAGKKAAINDGGWHRLEETFTFDASGGSQYSIEVIALSSAGSTVAIRSGDYIEMTGLQVELGKTATPYEQRSAAEELALCQRYYQVLIDNANGQRPVAAGRANSATTVEWQLPLTVGMRDITSLPQSNMGTVYLYSGGARVNSTSATISLNDDYLPGASYVYLRLDGLTVTDDRAYTVGGFEADAKLAVSGEL